MDDALHPNLHSEAWVPSISADGRFVVYYGGARLPEDDLRLVSHSPDDLDGQSIYQIYVYDRETGVTERVSRAPDGARANRHCFGRLQGLGPGLRAAALRSPVRRCSGTALSPTAAHDAASPQALGRGALAGEPASVMLRGVWLRSCQEVNDEHIGAVVVASAAAAATSGRR